ncbi:hypothetical protein [Fructobacillus durionis]|uniref:Uncharacterized protein n=1 Tax=Fructobacillus durionis TaxID=283737 RepID=A0A1I1H281_9LACO|nr:hypothetical protein [Fructobacillus durionis]SFC17855.1 hypothetical protein SAMN05660453_1230 [Fructobacillus durionis]
MYFNELAGFAFLVASIWFLIERILNFKAGVPLSKRGKWLLVTMVLSVLVMIAENNSGSSKIHEVVSLTFIVAIIWLIVEWRANRKMGVPLSKKGKWLIVFIVATRMYSIVSDADSSELSELFMLSCIVTAIWLIVESRANRKMGIPLSRKGKWLLFAFELSFLGFGVTVSSDAFKISFILAACLYDALLYLVIEWRTNRRSGLPLSKKGKWLLAVTVFFFLATGVSGLIEIENTTHVLQKSEMRQLIESLGVKL